MTLPALEVQIPDHFPQAMAELFRSYRTYLKIEKNYSEHTLFAYLRDLKFFFEFCLKEEIDILSVDVLDVRAYFADLKSAKKQDKRTQSRKLSSLRTFYKFLFREEKIGANPILQVSFPKTKKKLPKNFTPIETEDILDYEDGDKAEVLGKRDKAIVEVLYSTGLRVFELVNAKLSDLNHELTSLKVMGKRRKERFVFIGEEAQNALREYLEERGTDGPEEIFLNQRGGKLTTRGIRYILSERRTVMGMEKAITPHKFRHTFATDLLNAGADIRAVQELLGHASLSSTQVYLSVSRDRLKEVYRNAHPHAKK
ncbi:tyrosine recombinase XerC [Leptospira mtsangambouensis]|uniref:Tyrosine recombinase XerC n=1 Tax=Leptospira mtsangambouensis TaxID=2484912 RepID=A0ABY2NY75_9LEPT|nr:site-specific tyrosine recombinase/integron integrase [Leptospira mtsangambouensis]TGM74090.1 tyrosine recombinase XerC [Leptospira mtsangambouensis]